MNKNYKTWSGLLSAIFLITAFQFSISANAQVSGCSATPITFGVTTGNTTNGAPTFAESGTCFPTYGPTFGMWYQIPGTGNEFEVKTCGGITDFDTRLRVYSTPSGNCAALSCVAFNDDSDDCGIGSVQSYVKFNTIATRTYYILVDGKGAGPTNSGNYSLTVTEILPPVFCSATIAESALTGFCQGGVQLTATASEANATYLWSNGETTESIVVSEPNTLYSVTVTGPAPDFCVSTADITTSAFVAEDMLSAYTVIGMKEAHLHGDNTVLNGGVGAINIDGKAKAHENTMITASTTFMKAPIIEVNNGSVVTTQIVGVPSITLPDFLVKTAGTIDLEVPENGFYQATDSAYKKVKLKKNATIVFTQDNVSIKEFETDDNAIVKFSGCTYLYVEKKMKLDKGTLFNPDNFGVTVYVNNTGKDKAEIKEGSTFNGNIYAMGEIKAKGKEAKPERVHGDHTHPAEPGVATFMNGMFIGEKVHGDKNVTWNWNTDCGNSCTPAGTVPTNKTDVIVDQTIAFEINAYPNPFNNTFSLDFATDSESLVDVAVYSLTGTLVEMVKDVDPSEVIELGDQLSNGMYVVTVTQDGNTQFVKMIKSN